MKKPSPWMPMEEAVEEVMRHKGCSRRTARRLLANHMKEGKIAHRKVPKKPQFLDRKTAARLADQDPEGLLIQLSELVRAYHLTGDELLGELRAGRLVAGPINESVAVMVEMTHKFHLEDFVVTSGQLAEWAANPATPARLVDKFYRRMQ